MPTFKTANRKFNNSHNFTGRNDGNIKVRPRKLIKIQELWPGMKVIGHGEAIRVIENSEKKTWLVLFKHPEHKRELVTAHFDHDENIMIWDD